MFVPWLVALLIAQEGLSVSKPIEISGVVEDAKYCAATDEFAILQVRFQLRLQNVSDQPVILYRGAWLTEFSVGKSEANGNVSDVEFQIQSTVTIQNSEHIDASWPNPAFVLLKAGETFLSKTEVLFAAALKPEVPAAAGAGQNFLQSPAVIWPFSAELAGRLRAGWSKIGYLWTTPVLTKPIPFNVESMPKLETCK